MKEPFASLILIIIQLFRNSWPELGLLLYHERNIQTLAIEIFKFLHGLSPKIMEDVFKLKDTISYELRVCNQLYSRNPRTVRYGTESISYLAPKIWSVVPKEIKQIDSLSLFKTRIKKWRPECPCRICKPYLQHVGFM